MASSMESEETAIAVLVTAEEGAKNIVIDARDKSPYTHDALGGRPTFAGAWDYVYMMRRAEPDDGAQPIDETLVPPTCREFGPLIGPVLLTKLDDEYRPIDFTVEDLAALTTAQRSATTTSESHDQDASEEEA